MKIVKDCETFEKEMEAMFGPTANAFQPVVTHIQSGDCLEFVFAPDRYHAKRLDAMVTVYVSEESGEIVGSLIKGVRGICEKLSEKLPGFMIEIQSKKVRLEQFFYLMKLARPVAAESENQLAEDRGYDELIEAARESDLEAELCPA